jgi:hypothetical protein
MTNAILKNDIEFFNGVCMICVKKDTPIFVDLALNIAKVGQIYIDIEKDEYNLFN